MALPFTFEISSNLENTNQKQVNLSSPSLMLPDKSYYEDEAAKKRMMDPLEKAFKEAMQSWATVKKKRKDCQRSLRIDGELAKYAQSNEETSEIKNLHHPKTAEDINAYSDTFKFHDIINDYLGQESGDVNVPNPKYYENFAKVVNDKNLASSNLGCL